MIERWTCLRPSMMFSSKEGKEYEEGYYTLYSDTKILIDALEEIKKEFKWTHSNGVCAACIAIKALKEIDHEPK